MRKQSDFIYIIILFLAVFPVSAAGGNLLQTATSSQSADWNAVISGAAVCAPVRTTYGFAVLTDGRMISACTSRGTILWQRAVPGKPDPFLTVLNDDFLLTVNDGQTLSLTNPGGLTLWSAAVPYQIISAPKGGRDGRIFIRGKKDITCYSIKGICKWHITTDEESIMPIQELPDGSLVVFLQQLVNNKTAAIRVSPFGEVLEQITFSGVVTSAASCSNGLLLTFTDGGGGLCSIQGTEVSSLWGSGSDSSMFSGTSANSRSFFLPIGTSLCALIQSMGEDAKTSLINTSGGTVASVFIIPNINVNRLIYTASYDNGFLIADEKHAAFISADGRCEWSTVLPQKNNGSESWNFLCYTPDGFLIFCRTSWAVTGYRMMQNIQTGTEPEKKNTLPDYSSFIKSDSSGYEIWSLTNELGCGLSGSGRSSELLQGMYGKKEIKWTQELLEAGHAYLSFLSNTNSGGRRDTSVFSSDITGTDRMLRQLSLFGTNMFPPIIAKLITAEKNNTHMHTLLETAEDCAYDPDGTLLDSLDRALFSISAENDALLISLCDAVYSICRFMGRPAFYAHGRDILSKLMFPQYDSRVHAYARKTLTSIADLKL
jgi:hypothetical protein